MKNENEYIKSGIMKSVLKRQETIQLPLFSSFSFVFSSIVFNASCSVFFILPVKKVLSPSRSYIKMKYNTIWGLMTHLTDSTVQNIILPFTCCSSIIFLSFKRLFSMTSFFACSKSLEEAATLEDMYYRHGNVWRTDIGMFNIQHNIKYFARKYQIKYIWPIDDVLAHKLYTRMNLPLK